MPVATQENRGLSGVGAPWICGQPLTQEVALDEPQKLGGREGLLAPLHSAQRAQAGGGTGRRTHRQEEAQALQKAQSPSHSSESLIALPVRVCVCMKVSLRPVTLHRMHRQEAQVGGGAGRKHRQGEAAGTSESSEPPPALPVRVRVGVEVS